ncbi:MAG: glycosyltransferase family 4 protein [Thermoplasmataceae archaeon]
MNKIKIVILVRILWSAGAQKIAIKEAKELHLMGNDVELIFLRGKKLPEYNELLNEINYKIMSETGNSMLSPIYQYITHKFMPDRGIESRVDYNLIRKFPEYIKNKDIDYIICHDQLAGLAGYYSLKKFGIKYSVFIHEGLSSNKGSILSRLWYNYEHKILENATKVFSITDKVAKTVEEIQKVKAIANYPGMDINRITEFNKKEDALIAVSMWDYGRKPELYLNIIEKIPNFVLYFVGNFRIKELENHFKEEVKKRGLDERIIMKQGVTESELIELYQKSKFVTRFGFGEYGLGSAMEAIQNCDPLIINSDLGTTDLVNKYSCGLVLDNVNVEEIKKFMDENNNENSYKALQVNIVKLSKDYTWRKHAERLLISKK